MSKTLSIRIDEEIVKQLRYIKSKTGQNISWQIEKAVTVYIKRHRWNKGLG